MGIQDFEGHLYLVILLRGYPHLSFSRNVISEDNDQDDSNTNGVFNI